MIDSNYNIILKNILNFENNQLENQKCHIITYCDKNVNYKSRILDEAKQFTVFDSITAYGPEQISHFLYFMFLYSL